MEMIILLINLTLIFLAWLVMLLWRFKLFWSCFIQLKVYSNNHVLKCYDEVLELKERLTLTFFIFQRKKMEI